MHVRLPAMSPMQLEGVISGRCRDCGRVSARAAASAAAATCGRAPSISDTSSDARMKCGCECATFVKHGRWYLSKRYNNGSKEGEMQRIKSYCGLSGLQLRVVLEAKDTTDGALPSMSVVSKKLWRNIRGLRLRNMMCVQLCRCRWRGRARLGR